MEAPKRKGLGRGFGALIAQAPPPRAAERTIPTQQIAANPWQPRIHFDDAKLAEMAESIREHGIVEPLVVRARENGFELIAGERRLRAARLAGLENVPAVVREMDDREALEVTLIENLQREDLSALEEAAAYVRLMEEFGATQEEVARRVGRSRPAVANTIRLLQLPEAVREEMRGGRLSAGHARALLALDSPVEQTALARDAIRLALSVRQLEARIRLRMQPTGRKRASRDLHVADLEKQLMRSLGTRVRLHTRGQKGRIVIEFYSPNELERLLERLRRS
ncbi:MAG TPA: ParB/RepB/Spo0J family partition protein [Candidatus Binatia bacterium]|nr:ParB/RepB/Spo0J family partition protein [Candidatus Binatia bacterium]